MLDGAALAARLGGGVVAAGVEANATNESCG